MTDFHRAVYDIAQIRAAEAAAFAEGISEDELMARAAEAAFHCLQNRWPKAKRLAVLCGGGNNGGDAYQLAWLAFSAGYQLDLMAIPAAPTQAGPAQRAYERCCQAGLSVQSFDVERLAKADVIVDGMLGIGVSGALRPELTDIIAAVNALNMPVLAVDCPSGMRVEQSLANTQMIHASLTVSFIGLKPALVTGPSAALAGEVVVDDLQLGQILLDTAKPKAYISRFEAYQALILPRPLDSHKGDFGHVLIIGGNRGYAGAVRLAAAAALRCGAGLVSVASRAASIPVINSAFPEVMVKPIEQAQDCQDLLEKATVIVIGPGLGQDEWAAALWQCIQMCHQPVIVDADALHFLAKAPLQRDNWLLTPHPGEAARLLQTSVGDIQADRLQAVSQLNERYRAHVILKGNGSLTRTEGSVPTICTAGNPGMASGGMGDLLSGVIAALVAEGIDLSVAAHAGVALHAAAGDLAAAAGGERGLLASDLLPYLRELVN